MRRPIACAGPLMTVVYAVCANGAAPGWDFYNCELDDTEKAKMNTLFHYMGEHFGARAIGNTLSASKTRTFSSLRVFRLECPVISNRAEHW